MENTAFKLKALLGRTVVSLLILISLSSLARGQWVQTTSPLFGEVVAFANLSDTLFAAAGYDSIIYRSTNNGVDWTPLGVPIHTDILPFIIYGRTLFIGTNNGILKSTDAGEHWIEKDIPNGVPISVLAHNNKYLFASWTDGWIFRTSDNGDTWIHADTSIPHQPFLISLYANDSFLIAGTENGIYRSTDLGNSWVGRDTTVNKKYIGVIKMFGDTLYAAGVGFYRSTDSGLSWSVLNDSLIGYDMLQVGYNIFITGDNGVVVALNNGKNFQYMNTGLNDVGLIRIFESSGYLFVGSHSDWIYRSSDTGKTWTRMKGGFHTEIINLNVAGNSLFASTFYGLYRSTDEGDSWIPRNIGMSDDLTKGFAAIDSFLFVGLGNGSAGLYRSSDNGDFWNYLTYCDVETPIYAFDSSLMLNSTYLLRLSNDGLVVDDCLMDSFSVQSMVAMCKADNLLFAETSGYDGLLRSTDGGASWYSLHYFGSDDSIHITVLTTVGDTILAGTTHGDILRSTDIGNNWLKMNTGTAISEITSFASYGRYVFAGTYNSGVLISSDNGLNWSEFNESLTDKKINCLLIYNGYIYAGSDYHIWKRPLSNLGIPASENSSGFNIEKSVPNPFSSETNITFTCPKTMTLHFEVFDILGKKVFDGGNKVYDEGEDQIVLPGTGLPHGELFGRFSASDGTVKTIKLQHIE